MNYLKLKGQCFELIGAIDRYYTIKERCEYEGKPGAEEVKEAEQKVKELLTKIKEQ